MERLFSVECPSCHQSFVCHYEEMRHSGVKLFCPSCRSRFLPQEAASLDERVENSSAPTVHWELAATSAKRACAGIGRFVSPTGGWKVIDANYPELFPNPVELKAAWCHKTGIYPMHGMIVIKDGVLKTHPRVALLIS